MQGTTFQINNQDTEFTIIEPVKYGYHYASFGGLRVIMDKDGLINLTALCLLIKIDSKKYARWSELSSSQEIITKYQEWFEKNISKDLTKFMYKVKQTKGIAPTCCSGTYGIRNIAIAVARWLSFDFMLATDKIILDFFDREREAEIRRLRGDKNDLLAMVAEIKQQNNELIAQNKRLEDHAITAIKQNHETHITLEEVREDCREAMQVVYKTAPRTVQPETYAEREEFIGIMKINDPNNEKYPYTYICYRVQHKNIQATERRIRARHPRAALFLSVGPIPNSVHNYSCIKKYEGVDMRSVYLNVEGGDAALTAIVDDIKENELEYATSP